MDEWTIRYRKSVPECYIKQQPGKQSSGD